MSRTFQKGFKSGSMLSFPLGNPCITAERRRLYAVSFVAASSIVLMFVIRLSSLVVMAFIWLVSIVGSGSSVSVRNMA